MKIKYQPLHGAQDVEVRDILGGNQHATWHSGDVRDIPDAEHVIFRQSSGKQGPVRAIDALFSVGPDFVDADTGTNPLFTCSKCGTLALDDSFIDRRTLTQHFYRDDPSDPASARLCLPDFLAAHVAFEAHHVRANLDPAILAEARKRRAVAAAPAAPAAPVTTEA